MSGAMRSNNVNNKHGSAHHAAQSSLGQGLSCSHLLERRRRSRNASSLSSAGNDDGSCNAEYTTGFSLSQLYIPDQRQEQKRMPVSQSVTHVHSTERNNACIVMLSLRFMLMQRISDSNLRNRAVKMLQQAEMFVHKTAGNCCQCANRDRQDTSCTGGSENQRLAQGLAGFADEFSATRTGGLAAARARAMSLPSVSGCSEFRHRLDLQLASFESVRCRVALLMVLCSELAVKAVIQCNCLALMLTVSCCLERLCSYIAPIVTVRGWSYFISSTEVTVANSIGRRLLNALILIGCIATVARCAQHH